MIAPWILHALESEYRRSEWQPQPLYIEVPRPSLYDLEQETDTEPNPEPRRVIIIDYNTGEER